MGFFESAVCELGGSYVCFEKNYDITIFRTSDDSGSCDKEYAVKLIPQKFKDRNVRIRN